MVHVGPPPPAEAPPEGTEFRLGTHDDAEGLAALLTQTFGPWTPQGALDGLLAHAEVPETHLLLRGGRIVATASLQLPADFSEAEANVHYVGALPSESGRGLGRWVTASVVRAAHARGRTTVRLTTDDERLPAVATYLKLGFAPNEWHDSHVSRWETVRSRLR